MKIENMTKEEVVASIQSTINFFKRDIIAHGFFDDVDSIDNFEEENKKIKDNLKKLVDRLQHFKNSDISLYEKILKDVNDIEPFSKRVDECASIELLVKKSVFSNSTDKNARKLAELMKSKHIFDFINRRKKDIVNADLKVFGEFAPYVQLLWKQVKQEELLGLLLYVNSGKAAKDFQKMDELGLSIESVKSQYLYDSFKSSFHNLRIKDGELSFSQKNENSKVSAAYYLDYGVIINDEDKTLHFGFATSNFDTTEQKKQFFEIMNSLTNIMKEPGSYINGYTLKPIYITNAIVNENESSFKQTELQKPFLETFAEELTKDDKNILNKSSFLSILGNLASTDKLKGLDILDVVKINPFISGADTLKEYEAFQNIQKARDYYDDALAATMLRNYLMHTAESLVTVFEKVKVQNDDTVSMHHVHGMVLQHLQNILNASMYNFAAHLEEKDYLSDSFINRVEKVIARYDNVYTNIFNGQEPSKNIGITQFLGIDVERSMKKNLERVMSFKQNKESSKNSNIDAINNSLSEKSITKSVLDISSLLESLTPLLKEVPELKEKDIESMKEAIIQTYTQAIMKPSIPTFRDVLRGVNSYEAKEATLWLKRIQKWENQGDKLRGSSLVKKELMVEILENIKDLSAIKDTVVAYHDSCMEEKNEKLKRSIK
jgi:hypothetical protein